MKEENNFFYNSFKDKKIGLTSIRELGEAGAYTLFKEKTKKIYELSRKPISFINIKNAKEKITEKEIKIIDSPNEDVEDRIWCLLYCKFMCTDYLNWIYVVNNDMEDLFEHSVTPLEDEIKEIIGT